MGRTGYTTYYVVLNNGYVIRVHYNDYAILPLYSDKDENRIMEGVLDSTPTQKTKDIKIRFSARAVSCVFQLTEGEE